MLRLCHQIKRTVLINTRCAGEQKIAMCLFFWVYWALCKSVPFLHSAFVVLFHLCQCTGEWRQRIEIVWMKSCIYPHVSLQHVARLEHERKGVLRNFHIAVDKYIGYYRNKLTLKSKYLWLWPVIINIVVSLSTAHRVRGFSNTTFRNYVSVIRWYETQ